MLLPALLEVLRQDDIAVMPHRLHARLLADGSDVRGADLLRPRHVVLEVDLLAKVHLRGDRLQDQPLLPTIGQGELDL